MFPDRDLILFEQRGMGLSRPSLDCPEFNDPLNRADLSPDPDHFPVAATYNALTLCRSKLQVLVRDLGQYNTATINRDTDALRRQLGYDKIVAYGVSNGTRLALNYMRDFPDAVTAAILDSVVPPDIVTDHNYVFGLERTLGKIIALCHAQPNCRERNFDPAKKLNKAMRRFAENLVVVPFENRSGSEKLYLKVDDTVFVDILFNLSYGFHGYANLAQFISDLSVGRTDDLKRYAESMVYEGTASEFLYEAAYWSVTCHDEFDPNSGAAYMATE